MAILDIIPGIYILSILFKLKLLSTNNGWHTNIYTKTFGNLHDFDIFHFMWEFSSNRFVYVLNKLLYVQTKMYSKFSDEQIVTIIEALEDAADRAKGARSQLSNKASVRMSRIINKTNIIEAMSRGGSRRNSRENSRSPIGTKAKKETSAKLKE